MRKSTAILSTILVLSVLFAAGCSNQGNPSPQNTSAVQSSPTKNNSAEQPVAPEKNPPGDIPDSQVFVKYSSPQGGYELQTPEGWARETSQNSVTFTDKLDGLRVTVKSDPSKLTVDYVRKVLVPALSKQEKAFQLKAIKQVSLPGGPAVMVIYDSNSAPDSVTGKKVRLESNIYYFSNQGRLAALTIWAPLGADNVDQWNLIARSFRWR